MANDLTLSLEMQKGAPSQSPGDNGHIDVQLIVLDGFFASGLSVTIDVLTTANLLASQLSTGRYPLWRWSVRTRDGRPVRSSGGLSVVSEGPLDAEFARVAFVFGPGIADAQRIERDIERNDARNLYPVLQALKQRGAIVAASCSSTFLLAEAGLLNGAEATTSWWLAPLFRARYSQVQVRQDQIVCASGSVLTAGAAMAQLDLTLSLVRSFMGHEIAHACAQYLVIDEARTSQAPFLITDHLTRHDELVARAERWAAERLAKPIELAELARAVGCSERTLTRHFIRATGLSPLRFLRKLRLETASRLLATTERSVQDIASTVGYDDERAFRRAFLAHFRTSPGVYRRSHRVARDKHSKAQPTLPEVAPGLQSTDNS